MLYTYRAYWLVLQMLPHLSALCIPVADIHRPHQPGMSADPGSTPEHWRPHTRRPEQARWEPDEGDGAGTEGGWDPLLQQTQERRQVGTWGEWGNAGQDCELWTLVYWWSTNSYEDCISWMNIIAWRMHLVLLKMLTWYLDIEWFILNIGICLVCQKIQDTFRFSCFHIKIIWFHY